MESTIYKHSEDTHRCPQQTVPAEPSRTGILGSPWTMSEEASRHSSQLAHLVFQLSQLRLQTLWSRDTLCPVQIPDTKSPDICSSTESIQCPLLPESQAPRSTSCWKGLCWVGGSFITGATGHSIVSLQLKPLSQTDCHLPNSRLQSWVGKSEAGLVGSSKIPIRTTSSVQQKIPPIQQKGIL